MSESVKEKITTDLQKAKSEGKIRIERIQAIVRDAFSQTVAEVKEGSGEIRAIVKGSLSENLEVVDEKVEGSEETAARTPSTSSKSLILAIFKAIKNRLFVQLHQEATNLPHRYAKLKNQASNLDANLTERYGDRYIAVKQRLEKGAAWYNTATAEAKTMETTVLQQKQTEFENKLGEAGTTFAQKERQVKQLLKERLATIKL